MKLIVGLGNPGRKYSGTRHNAGYLAVDRLAGRHGLTGAKEKFHAGVIEGRVVDQRVMLMQPTTLMNRSGLAVGEAVRYFKIEPADLMVAVDDTSLPVGAIRMRAGGSAGGHNGLADIEQAIGTQNYPRLRIGVGEPVTEGGRPIPQADYVLAPFSDEQKRALEPALDRAAEALETWLSEGIEVAMSRHNSARKAETGDPAANNHA